MQREIVMPVDVTNDGLYRIIFRYVNLGSLPVLGNATLIPVNVNQDGRTSPELHSFNSVLRSYFKIYYAR